MLRVLQAAFSTAFKGPVGIGALVSFLVTVSGMAIFNIGAPFWGIVFGYLTSAVLERQDLAGPRG
jgi:benzoate membrane transport protein